MSEPIRVIEVDTELNQDELSLDTTLHQNDLSVSSDLSENDLLLNASPDVDFSFDANNNVVDSVADSDYVMISSNNIKKKTLFSTIKSALSSVFASFNHTHTASEVGAVSSNGGVVNGDLTVNNLRLPGYNGTTAGFLIGSGNKHIDIGWQWDGAQGGGIALRSTNYTSDPGKVLIYARRIKDNYEQTTQLALSPDGTITWGGLTIPTFITKPEKTKLPLVAYNKNGIIKAGYIMNRLSIGTGVVGSDKGDGVSPRYFPTLWTCNIDTVLSDGDEIFIKTPCAGSLYGVYISIDNGVTYKPVILSGSNSTPLTTEYPINSYLKLVYESSSKATNIYDANGGDTTKTVTGVWRIH